MKRTLATGLITAGLMILPAAAQTTTDRSMSGSSSMDRSGTYASGTSTEMARTTPMGTETETDFDLGWLGLVGLAGLAGLTRKRHTHHDHVHTGDHVHTDTRRL